jgi:hypothetical protein
MLTAEVDGITVFFPAELSRKEGVGQISIRLRRFLLWQWLEIDGAKGITAYN